MADERELETTRVLYNNRTVRAQRGYPHSTSFNLNILIGDVAGDIELAIPYSCPPSVGLSLSRVIVILDFFPASPIFILGTTCTQYSVASTTCTQSCAY